MLLRNLTDNAILILTVTTGVMVLGRAFAEPVVHRLNPAGVLLASAVLATLGIYLLSTATAGSVFFAALIFGLGVCYFWPTMIGYAETVRLLAAWCELRQDFRHFRTDRIDAAKFLEERIGCRPGELRSRWKRHMQAQGLRLP